MCPSGRCRNWCLPGCERAIAAATCNSSFGERTMHSVEIRCFASLAKHTPAGGHAQIAAPGTAGDLMRALGIPAGEVAIIFVNGSHAEEATELRDGDRVGLFPAVGGG